MPLEGVASRDGLSDDDEKKCHYAFMSRNPDARVIITCNKSQQRACCMVEPNDVGRHLGGQNPTTGLLEAQQKDIPK